MPTTRTGRGRIIVTAFLLGTLSACGAAAESTTAAPALESPSPGQTWVEPVLASNAREAATEVLSSLDDANLPSEDAVAAQISQLLVMADESTRMAVPGVRIDGTRVGVAMGWGRRCVLVQRVGGVVTDVYIDPVLLEPGEMGCGPETAISESIPQTH